MKRISLFFLLMVITFGLMAQNVIVGKVKWKNDEQPIAGVSVILGSTNQQVFTSEGFRCIGVFWTRSHQLSTHNQCQIGHNRCRRNLSNNQCSIGNGRRYDAHNLRRGA